MSSFRAAFWACIGKNVDVLQIRWPSGPLQEFSGLPDDPNPAICRRPDGLGKGGVTISSFTEKLSLESANSWPKGNYTSIHFIFVDGELWHGGLRKPA